MICVLEIISMFKENEEASVLFSHVVESRNYVVNYIVLKEGKGLYEGVGR